jgi:biotin carboxyl carrier protein
MSYATRIPPARRPELVIRAVGAEGRHVVKDPVSGQFYDLGAEEAFLLEQLDGRRTAPAICSAFAKRFGQGLNEEELAEFEALARKQGFLSAKGSMAPAEVPVVAAAPTAAPASAPESAKPASPRWKWGNLLYWRTRFFDPDRFFNWLEPKIRFFWTPGFVVVSVMLMVAAVLALGSNWRQLITDFPGAMRWETIAMAWMVLILATFCHEFAHGLTCKHYGGEVHEVGFLLMMLIPCFYCNVSDSYLFRSRRQRLLVMLAGGYCDLCVWAVAVLVWRLTANEVLLHYLAFVVLSVCGGRIFFNFNPFMRLDGYYMLSDWVDIPNLRSRAQDRLKAHIRRLLWGAEPVATAPRGLFLTFYGLVTWTFSVAYLGLMIYGFMRLFGDKLGMLGSALAGLLGYVLMRGLFKGFTNGEVARMLLFRRLRTLVWLAVLGAVPTGLYYGSLETQPGGTFHVRPVLHTEVRSPLSAFVRVVNVDEGDRVESAGSILVLEIPDLESKITQKQSESRAVQAKLRLLECGARPELIQEQRQKVERALAWRDLAKRDLARERKTLQEELSRFDEQMVELQAELKFARYALLRDQRLYAQEVLPEEQVLIKKKNYQVAQSQVDQVVAQKRARETKGTQEAEVELARREKELADARSALTLLEAGSRPEEIDAERARLAALQEELRFLESQKGKLTVRSPLKGVITTPRLKEKVGQFLREGDLICTVDEWATLEVEIVMDEQELPHVQAGFPVEMKVRALPFQSFHAEVARIAPIARVEAPADPLRPAPPPSGEKPSTIGVYCHVDGEVLRPGMTGYARISCGRRNLGEMAIEKVVRLVRPEYWLW